MSFYEKVNWLCQNKGITVSYLLSQVGVSRSAQSKWKAGTGKPSNLTVKAIADYFGLPFTYFTQDASTVIHDNHGFIGENNATVTFVQNEKKDEQTLALLELWEKMDVLKKAQLIAYAISLSQE